VCVRVWLQEYLTEAEKHFDTSQRVSVQGNIPGLLGSALCNVYMGHYKKALAIYASALYLNPKLSLVVRGVLCVVRG
jgi:hypothetical protein